MSKDFIVKILVVAALVFIVLPSFSFAAVSLPNVWDPSTIGSTLLVCTGANAPGGALNANCYSLCDLVFQILWIVYIAIAWVIWIIAPLSFVVGGVMLMLTGANPGMESSAKSILKGAVIGVVIVLCSYIIINTVVGFFGIHGLGGFGGQGC